MSMDGSEDHRKPRPGRTPTLLTIASTLASAGLVPAGVVDMADLLLVSPTFAAATASLCGLVNWLRSKELSVRFVVERKSDVTETADVNAKFDRYLGEDEAHNQNLVELHALPDGSQDPSVMLAQRLLAVPECEWPDAEVEVWRIAATQGLHPWARVVIASGLAKRNTTKGVALLVQIARESKLGSTIQLMAIDELRRWDLEVAAVEYEYLCADECMGVDGRIVAGGRLGEIDTERGAAALLAIVLNVKIRFDDRFNAAESSGHFSVTARERALWVLANDSTQKMTNRVSASGRLFQLGVPGAQELLESGAVHAGIECEARELCVKFLEETQRR
jgi:hypothetical protein